MHLNYTQDNQTDTSPLHSNIDYSNDYDDKLLKLDLADSWMLLLIGLLFLIIAIYIFVMAWKVRKNIEVISTLQYIFSKK